MRTMRPRFRPLACRTLPVLAAACFGVNLCTPARAVDDQPVRPVDSQSVQVALIQQDSSDCTNSTVKDDPDRTKGGVDLTAPEHGWHDQCRGVDERCAQHDLSPLSEMRAGAR